MSTTSRRSLRSVAISNTDPTYLNHRINQQEIQIRALDEQLFDSNQARTELEARLTSSNDDTDTRSSCTYDADEIGAQEELSALQAKYNECTEENQRMLQDVKSLKGCMREFYQLVRKGPCKIYWR